MKDERTQWIPFALLCLASVVGVVLLGELAGTPERLPPEPDNSDEVYRVELRAAHIHVEGLVSNAVTVASIVTDDYIETRRETVSTAGAEILLPRSHTRLAHTLVQRESEEAPLLLIAHRSLNTPEAPLIIELFQRMGGLWRPLDNPFREEFAFRGVLGVGDVQLGNLDPEDPEPSFAGAVLPISTPTNDVCDDGLGTRRTHHLMFAGSRPRFTLNHISGGTQMHSGRVAYARLDLVWDERGTGGEAVFALAERHIGPRVTVFRYPFTFSEGGFSIRNGIANLFNEEVGAANTLRNREADSAAAQILYRRLVRGLELIGPLEGPTPYCIEIPHRARPARIINSINWRNQLNARILQARLPIATYLAEQGQGPRALALLELDPTLARRRLGDTAEGERLIFILTHPTTSTRLSLQLPRNFSSVQLAERVTAVAPSLQNHEKPLIWRDNNDLLIPSVPDADAAGRAASRSLLAYHVLNDAETNALITTSAADIEARIAAATATLPDATRAQQHLDAVQALRAQPNFRDAQIRLSGAPIPSLVAANAFSTGALQSAHTQSQGRTHASNLIVGARSWALERADAVGDYTGSPILNLSTTALRPETASPDAMRRYVPIQAPYDLSPRRIHLLLDYTWDCRGVSMIMCEPSNPELCEDTAELGLVPGDWDGNAQVAREDIHLHIRRLSLPNLCPEGQRYNASVRLEPLGWADDSHLIFLLNEEHIVIHVPDEPKAPLSRVEIELDVKDERWFWPFGGPERRFRLFLDDYALWTYDRERQRYFIVAWADSSNFTIANASRPWRTALAPDGRSVAIWQTDVGLSIGSVYGLR